MSLNVYDSAADFRNACEHARSQGYSVALVPTMGALHAGHAALIRAAQSHAQHVAVTIFVNPAQFGPAEDFSRYPRTLERDLALCRTEGVHSVFVPSVADMYPTGEQTRVFVRGLADYLCGPIRPGHFEGVATVVAKFFALAGPCIAIFGRKDYQQLKIIERMVLDLLMPVRIVAHPTVREPDGVALSSRNAYLSAQERQAAAAIPRVLSESAAAFSRGERRADVLLGAAVSVLEQAGLRPQYVTLADPASLVPLPLKAHVGQCVLLALAVLCGQTRLIDNIVLGEESAPGVSLGGNQEGY